MHQANNVLRSRLLFKQRGFEEVDRALLYKNVVNLDATRHFPLLYNFYLAASATVHLSVKLWQLDFIQQHAKKKWAQLKLRDPCSGQG